MVPYVIPAKEDPRSDGDTPLQELGGVNDLLFSGNDLSLHSTKVEVDSGTASSSGGVRG